MGVYLLTLLLLVLCTIFFFVRVLMVERWHHKLIHQVGVAANRDAALGKADWFWRWREYNRVECFHKMVIQFWRPLNSFYNTDRLLAEEPPCDSSLDVV